MRSEELVQIQLIAMIYKNGFLLQNNHMYGWEADALHVTNDMYVHEYEIKLTQEDLSRDFDKTVLVINGERRKEYKKRNVLLHGIVKRPNKFYYVVPEWLNTSAIEKKFGILKYRFNRGDVVITSSKPAQFLHKDKISALDLMVATKTIFRKYCAVKYGQITLNAEIGYGNK